MISMEKDMKKEEESLSPIEKELLALLREKKKIGFDELAQLNIKYMGALGKLKAKGFASITKDMELPKPKRKILSLNEGI